MENHRKLIQIPQTENCSLKIYTPQKEQTTFDEVENAALSAFRAEELSQLYEKVSLPKSYEYDKDGWLIYREYKEEGESSCIRICSHLEVVARTRNNEGESHGRLLRFPDPDGLIHEWAMPMALLAGDGAGYREELLSKGLLIAPGANVRKLLATFIQESYPKKTVRCVEQPGWNKECTAFVFHNETVGCSGKEALILQSKSHLVNTQKSAGTLLEWQKLPLMCVGNSRLIMALSVAFAPPLLFPLGIENGGIHFQGSSSSGKTTCLRVAASVWGNLDFMQQWRATVNGLEGIATWYNDCLLCLDEMGQMDATEVGNAAYMLANGSGKARGTKLGENRERKQWRVIFLSSGEITLADHISEGGKIIKAGQEVRVLNIAADNKKHGCFEELHGFDLAKNFAEHLMRLSSSCYGTAGPEFIKSLVGMGVEKIREKYRLISESLKYCVSTDASGQVQRMFNRFVLIAVAGELATEFGITGWEEGSATKAVIACFDDWVRARGGIGSQEERKILSQIKYFFVLHGESRFTDWHADEQSSKTFNRVGYRKKENDGYEFFVFKETLKEIIVGFDEALVLKICLKHGLLRSSSNGEATRSERLPGHDRTTRVYRFTSRVLSDQMEDESAMA